jgi:hypothetical protein
MAGESVFTLDNGTVEFRDDGSTRVELEIPASPGGTGEPQYDRLAQRLAELAAAWGRRDG